MNKTTSIMLISCLAAPLAAQTAPVPPQNVEHQPPPGTSEFQRLDREIGDLTRQLGDWDAQHDAFDQIIRNVWENNGWDSESDLFARDMALEINEIPPWKFNQRLKRLNESIDSRYQLNDQQRQQAQSMMFRESIGMVAKYGPTMLGNVRELVETRVNQQPVTPEQVARWEKAMDPMVGEFEKDFQRLTSRFSEILTPDQRQIFDRDVQSASKRMNTYMANREAWKRGEWDARQWGLQDDPVQLGHFEIPTGPTDAIPDGAARSYDESTWEVYVRAFIAYYDLDSGQVTKCMSILDRLVDEASYYRKRHRDELANISTSKAEVAREYEPIRLLFIELKSRLDRIPTDNQIRTAAVKNAQQPRGPTRKGRPGSLVKPPKRQRPRQGS